MILNSCNSGLGEPKFLAVGEPEEFVCKQCGQKIDSIGFMCENNRELILCERCQSNYKMRKCSHGASGEHLHIKFARGYNKSNDETTKNLEI